MKIPNPRQIADPIREGKTWGEPLTMTYSIITTDSVFASDYLDGTVYSGAHENIVNATSAMITAMDKAFALISQYTGITFVKVPETSTQVGDIRIGVTTSSKVLAANVPAFSFSSFDNGPANGDIWLHSTGSNLDGDWSTGSFGFMTLLHEIGHSMGLKHPHALGNPASGWIPPKMSTVYDHLGYTLMSYRDYLGDDFEGEGEGFYLYNQLRD